MITAKNYAAQAEASLRKAVEMSPKLQFDPREIKNFNGVADLIRDSVHFVVPDGCSLLGGGGAGLLGKDFNLPYPKITVEYWSDRYQAKYVALAYQNETAGGVTVTGASYWKDDCNLWLPCPIAAWITEGITKVGMVKTDSYAILFPTIKKIVEKKTDVAGMATVYISAVIELLEALSCRNVSTTNYQDASTKNGKRISEGKLPFYETKMLVVDTRAMVSSKGVYLGGTHASPRQHLRRGHIRRLPKDNIWIQPCVVGDPNKGTIHKQYAVI